MEFRLSIVDGSGKKSGATEGYTYSRLLCIAFDMAVTRAFASKAYPHFIYHDGIFESLNSRKKVKLIEVMKEYTSSGVQHIITLIDTELPTMEDGNILSFDDNEIILTLHDERDEGRQFKMPSW